MTRKTVLITGGAKRLGAEIACHFGEAGWHVIIHYRRSAEAARQLADSLPSAETVQCDLADGDAATAMIRDLAARLADWRCLVCNAASFAKDEVTALDPETNRQVMTVNATSPARMAQAYLASATSKAGRRVIQFTDQKLANMNPDFFSYTMSKAAADASARMLAMAAGPENRIYRLAPGAILPSHDQSEEEAERSHRRNLLTRHTEPGEIADAALFLAEGPLASGQALFIDSGQHLLDQPRDVIYLERGEASE